MNKETPVETFEYYTLRKPQHDDKTLRVFDAILSERAYQNDKWYNPSDGPDNAGHNDHSVTEWLTYMRHYVEEGLKAETLSYDNDGSAGAPFLRKVAALAVAGMQQHGAEEREGFERTIVPSDDGEIIVVNADGSVVSILD